ncbi:SurA N-terminal domain-containing protein [Candidatus Saccharibacteria bacterium]|nr:SurA N-terminal domain-containing protein [Candidatus Saccharibacteria bacterium]
MKKINIKKKDATKKTEREKVEERREEVLARGRKFKYPLQYAKHRLVVVTIIVAVVALLVMTGMGWFALYKAQDTGDVLYRITQILPVPVADVDGEKARYSDYLMIYKSTITPVEQQQGSLGDTQDADTMRAHYKRLALDDAEDYTYAIKLARELNIEVTNEEVNESYEEHRKIGGTERSEEGFKKILEDNFGLSETEYKRMLYLSIIKNKVSEKIDENATKIANEVAQKIREKEGNLQAVAEEMGDKVRYEETGGLVDKMNVDGGRATEAMKLSPGQVSERLISTNGDGYYFVKLIEKTDTTVNYISVKIPWTEFAKRMKELRAEDKIKEYIELQREELAQ